MDNKQLYAVAGNPVLHSKSPFLFGQFFNNYGIDASYTRISAENCEELVSTCKLLDLRGFNITSPFKEAIISLLDDLEASAKQMQSVNTVINHNGKLIGFNTDAAGVINTLRNRKIEIRGRNCVVLGAGGAARSAVSALMSEVANVVVFNRTQEKAEQIAAHFRCNAGKLTELNSYLEKADIIVSTVNISNFDAFLKEKYSFTFPFEKIKKGAIIFDAIYYNSLLKKIAEKNNIIYISGIEWLKEQARLSFDIFNNAFNISQTSVSDSLLNQIELNISLKTRNIILIGFSGAGKTSTGKQLAELLNYEFADSDSIIEHEEQLSISDIFRIKGENYFRHKEIRLLKKLSRMNNLVISCGGGIVSRIENSALLKSTGAVIYLYSPLSDCLNRIRHEKKPLLGDPLDENKAEMLWEARKHLYFDCSDLIVRTAESSELTAKKIFREISSL